MLKARLAAFTAVATLLVACTPPYDSGFDAEAWLNADINREGNARYRMADDLVRYKRLIGRTRKEVTAQLGPPEKTPYFADYDMVYVLGPERGFLSIDYEWLILRLDRQGKVTEAHVVTD